MRAENDNQLRTFRDSDPDLWKELIRHQADLTKFFTGHKDDLVQEVNQSNKRRETEQKQQLILDILENKCEIVASDYYYQRKDFLFA